jgi:hypothetical protein
VFAAARALVLLVAVPQHASADRVFTVFFGAAPSAQSGFIDLAGAAGATKPTWGVSVGRVGDVAGWEVDASALPGFFSSQTPGLALVSGSQASTFMLNGVVSVPRRWTGARLRPYGAAGGGLIKARIDDVAGLLSTNVMLTGFDLGGGVFVLPWRHGGIRGDARYYRSERKEAREATLGFGPAFLDFWRVSGGGVLRF